MMIFTQEQRKWIERNGGCATRFFPKEERQREFDELDMSLRLTVTADNNLLEEAKKMLHESNHKISVNKR
jgi:hypothetical protein